MSTHVSKSHYFLPIATCTKIYPSTTCAGQAKIEIEGSCHRFSYGMAKRSVQYRLESVQQQGVAATCSITIHCKARQGSCSLRWKAVQTKHLQWYIECWHGGRRTPSLFYDAGALEAPNDIGWQNSFRKSSVEYLWNVVVVVFKHVT